MKLIIFAIAVGVCSADVSHLTRGASYLPPHASGQYNSGASSYSGAGSFNARSSSYNGGAAHQAGAGAFQAGYNGGAAAYSAGGFGGRSQDINAHTLRESSDVSEHGFAYDFETSNGIKAQQHGEATNGVQSQGAFSYKGDDGHDYSITYTADENGYRPQGAHLPTPPPVPEEILRSLEQNARDEAAGLHNEGSYNEQYDGAGSSQYSSARYSAQPSRQYLAPVVAQRNSPSFNAQSGYRY